MDEALDVTGVQQCRVSLSTGCYVHITWNMLMCDSGAVLGIHVVQGLSGFLRLSCSSVDNEDVRLPKN